MGRITSDDIHYKLEEINSLLGKKYALEHPKEERDWRTYEQEFAQRIKTAMRDLDLPVNEAVSVTFCLSTVLNSMAMKDG